MHREPEKHGLHACRGSAVREKIVARGVLFFSVDVPCHSTHRARAEGERTQGSIAARERPVVLSAGFAERSSVACAAASGKGTKARPPERRSASSTLRETPRRGHFVYFLAGLGSCVTRRVRATDLPTDAMTAGAMGSSRRESYGSASNQGYGVFNKPRRSMSTDSFLREATPVNLPSKFYARHNRTPLNLAICVAGVLASLCIYGVLQSV